MTITAITDIHAHTRSVSALEAVIRHADLVLLCGDITHFGHRNEMKDMIRLVRNINPSLLAVSGNCDYPDAEEYLVEENQSLDALTREFEGYAFLGLSGSLPCPGKTPQEHSEEHFNDRLASFKIPQDKPLVMVSHQPPFGTLNDRATAGHVGSRAVRSFIEKIQPLICFTGHIHEGVGIDHIGKTAVVNPGPAGNGCYARAELYRDTVKSLEIYQI